MEDSQNPVSHSEEVDEQSLWRTIFSSLHLMKSTLLGLKNVQDNLWNVEIDPNSISVPVGVACSDSENADRDAQICNLSQQLSGLKNEKRSADAEICKRKEELIELMSTLTIFETDSECKTTELSSLVEQREGQIGQLERTIAENKLLLQGKDSDIFRLSKLAEERAEELLQLRELLDVQRTKENQDVQRLVVCPETVEIAVQCQRDQETLTKKMARKEKQLSDRFKTESEFRDQDSTRLLAAKDKEIRRLKTLAETNAELLTLVANLRQQLDLRGFSGDYASVLSKGNPDRLKPIQTPLTKMFHSRGRILSASQNSNLNSLESEPEIELESTGILTSISRRSSISSRTGSFKYKDLTPKRLAELQRRNSAQLPHMKSSYPVEQSDRTWRHDTPEQNSTEVGSSAETENFTEVKTEKKEGFLKKLSSSLHKGKKNGKAAKNKENVEKTKMTRVMEKPVAFVVDITPPEKKKAPQPKR